VQPIKVGLGDGESDASSHADDSHADGGKGIPLGLKCQVRSTSDRG